MENTAAFGFQHLVQPQTWLCAVWPATVTVTGSFLHLQVSVPPEKFFDAGAMPLSTDGCIDIALAILSPR
jgi:hypothetical protein